MHESRMRKLLWMSIIMIFTILVAGVKSQGQYYQNSYALVVGIDKYQSPKWQKLNYAVRDAKSIANILTSQGFEVFTLYNQQATRNAIMRQQNDIARQLRRNDRVLIFFAGHGHTETIGNEEFGYIVPHDGADTSNYISMTSLQEQSRKMGKAKHQLFIMDSCYGGLLGIRGGALDENDPYYLDEVTKRQARLVLMAGGKDQSVVDNGPGGHSVFTGALLEGLGGLADVNNDGYIVFPELCNFVLSTAWNDYQTPTCSSLPGHQMGEFVFRSPESGTSQRRYTPAPSDNEISRGSSKLPDNRSIESNIDTIAILVVDNEGNIDWTTASQLSSILQERGRNISSPSLFTKMFVSSGQFERIFQGDSQEAQRLQLQQYFKEGILGKKTVSFIRNPDYENMLTATVNLELHVVSSVSGTVQNSFSSTARGPGFSEKDAEKIALERILKEFESSF